MGTAIVDQLINTTNVVQAVTYNFRYRLNDPRNGGIAFCDHGVDTTITVYVNPTPRFTVTIADTIVCDSTTITLNVADLLGAVEGTKVYDLTTTYTAGRCTGSRGHYDGHTNGYCYRQPAYQHHQCGTGCNV